MTKRQTTKQANSTQIAGRILVAWRGGRALNLKEEFDRLASSNEHELSSLEQERMELLAGIIQVLCTADTSPSRHRAALRLLEHLDDGVGSRA